MIPAAFWEAAGWAVLSLGCGVIVSAVLQGIRRAAIKLRAAWRRWRDI